MENTKIKKVSKVLEKLPLLDDFSDDSLKWKVNTPGLLREIAECGLDRRMGIYKVPLNIFQSILAEVADRAIELNDKKLNKLMIRLSLYESENKREMMEYLKF